MKLGPVDGSVEEVRDLLQNDGLKIQDYLEKPPGPLRIRYLLIPVLIFLFALVLIVMDAQTEAKITTLKFLGAFAAGLWLTVSTQLRFKNTLATYVIAVGALLMILLATGIFSPRDAAEFAKGMAKEK